MPITHSSPYPGGFLVAPHVARDSGGDLSHNIAGYVHLDQANVSTAYIQLFLPRHFATAKAMFADGVMNSGDVVVSASLLKVEDTGMTTLSTITDEVISIPNGSGYTYGLVFDLSDVPINTPILIQIERDPTHTSDDFPGLLSFNGWLFE